MEGTDEGFDVFKNIDKDHIVRFLKLYHVEKYDIAFIAIYRKKQCLRLLIDEEQDKAANNDRDASEGRPRLKWHRVLWAIKELDGKWLRLQNRKSSLQRYYNKRYKEEYNHIYDKAKLSRIQQLFSIHFPPTEMAADGQFRRPKRKSLYEKCVMDGLQNFAGKFGYKSERYGLQDTQEKVRMEVLEDPQESPEVIASRFTSVTFKTPEVVLKGARYMAARHISCEPSFRRHVRSIFMNKALVSTSPTNEGDKAIGFSHRFAGVKCLPNKSLSRFVDAQWLLIQKAEEEKLLQVTIKLPEGTLNELTSESNNHYLGIGLSNSSRLWKEQRKLILQEAFLNFLLPSMEKEIRALLTTREKYWLLMECQKRLWNKVSVIPYELWENNVGVDYESGLKVMACCWDSGNPATTFVMLDSSGQVRDVLCDGPVSLCSQNVNEDAQWVLIQKAEEEKLLQVTIKLPERTLNELTSESNNHYLGVGLSNSSRLWKEQRKLILQEAFLNFLLPSMEKEIRALLTTRAKYWLLMEYQKRLWSMVSVVPYELWENNVGVDYESGLKVMACIWDSGNSATTFVMLDSSGQVRDVLCDGPVSLCSQKVNEQQRKINDQQCVLKFLRDHEPHVVVLGAVNCSCARLEEDLQRLLRRWPKKILERLAKQ